MILMSQPDSKTLYFYEDLTNNGRLFEENACKLSNNGYYQYKCKLTTKYQNSKKVKYLSKDKKRPFTFKIRHDLIFVRFEAYFFYESQMILFAFP